MEEPKKLLNPEECAELLGVSKQSLARWRMVGEGPPFFKLSDHCVRYDWEAVKKWIEEKRNE